jgi:hypothetical protein
MCDRNIGLIITRRTTTAQHNSTFIERTRRYWAELLTSGIITADESAITRIERSLYTWEGYDIRKERKGEKKKGRKKRGFI